MNHGAINRLTLDLFQHELAIGLSTIQQELQPLCRSSLLSVCLVRFGLLDSFSFCPLSLFNFFLLVLLPVRGGLGGSSLPVISSECVERLIMAYVSGGLSCSGLHFFGSSIRALHPSLLLSDSNTRNLSSILQFVRDSNVKVFVNLEIEACQISRAKLAIASASLTGPIWLVTISFQIDALIRSAFM